MFFLSYGLPFFEGINVRFIVIFTQTFNWGEKKKQKKQKNSLFPESVTKQRQSESIPSLSTLRSTFVVFQLSTEQSEDSLISLRYQRRVQKQKNGNRSLDTNHVSFELSGLKLLY